MGRPSEYEIQASWVLHGDDKDVQYEIDWIEEKLAIHNVKESCVTGQRLVHAADQWLCNQEGHENDPDYGLGAA